MWQTGRAMVGTFFLAVVQKGTFPRERAASGRCRFAVQIKYFAEEKQRLLPNGPRMVPESCPDWSPNGLRMNRVSEWVWVGSNRGGGGGGAGFSLSSLGFRFCRV